jgi:integrase/recombinase XerD
MPKRAALEVISPHQLQEIGTEDLLVAFADFLNIDIANGDAAADTISTYSSQIQQYLNWCQTTDINPARATRYEIKEYRRWMVEAKKYKAATIALKLSAVRRFYEAAIAKGLIAVNPATGIKPPREKRDPAERITFLEQEEAQDLLAAIAPEATLASKRDRALLAIMTLEGTRTVEMHRTNLADIVQQGNNIGIRVEGKRHIRLVPLTPKLAEILMEYLAERKTTGEKLKPTSPLFIALDRRSYGQRLSRRGIRQIVDRYLLKSELKHRPGRTISAHSLRHTAGTLALRNGADLRQVQDLLGHSDPRTTSIYAHIGDRWANNPALKLELW